ncbi:hypothetical protein T492DRAFT_836960 [Pavlovales sp. CCMP2436]|nr:hypothetical protein T492DRAFT_836960 [Pavlovales sp. CCMP2436]
MQLPRPGRGNLAGASAVLPRELGAKLKISGKGLNIAKLKISGTESETEEGVLRSKPGGEGTGVLHSKPGGVNGNPSSKPVGKGQGEEGVPHPKPAAPTSPTGAASGGPSKGPWPKKEGEAGTSFKISGAEKEIGAKKRAREGEATGDLSYNKREEWWGEGRR